MEEAFPMQVTLLGTMGWMPSERRETTCTACRDGDELLLFDAGTGLRRLLTPAGSALLDGVRRVHLFLSHYHLDHTCGLAYLPGVLPGRGIVMHPPAAEITGVDPAAAVAGLLRRPYNPRDLAEIEEITLEPLHEGGNEVAGHEIRVRRQQHTDTSVSWRVDDAFVQATDTRPDPGVVEFASGVGVLLHEAWYTAGEPHLDAVPAELRRGFATHSDAREVAGLAASADVRRLVLIHLNPLLDEEAIAAMAARAREVFAGAELRDDGERIDTALV
jgi:ribonuclease BN (tRNA processing enzyme)